jgi:hypothetical protein
MTIAAAFRCCDGVLLGTDTLISDGLTKTYENKVFQCSLFGNLPLVLMTGAGNFPRVKEFADRLLVNKTFDNLLSCDDAKQAIRKTILDPWYQDAVKQTNTSGYNLEFLFALKDFDGRTDILHLSNTDLYPIANYWSIGTGAVIAKYLSAWLYSASLPCEIFSVLALHIFQEAKDHGDGCGGDTKFLQLLDGFDDPNTPRVRIPDAGFLWGLYDQIKPLIYACVNKNVSEDIFNLQIHRFGSHMRAIHDKLKGQRA